MLERILLSRNLVNRISLDGEKASPALAGTVLANLLHYGHAPSADLYAKLLAASEEELRRFWSTLEPALSEMFAEDRDMGAFVVYKNFPAEVLQMDQADYWVRQIGMYWGLWRPEDVAEAPVARDRLFENIKLRILSEAPDNALEGIRAGLVAQPSKWSPFDENCAAWLFEAIQPLDLAAFGHKGNGIALAASTWGSKQLVLQDATDVLRLAAALSGGDASLRKPTKFRKFSRSARRTLLTLLEATANPAEDFLRRPEPWKRLLSLLHPGDGKFPRVSAAYDILYKGRAVSFNTGVEAKLHGDDLTVLDDLATRPGEYIRRFRALVARFGVPAFDETRIRRVLSGLTVWQALKFRKFVETEREHALYPPSGSWSRAKLFPAPAPLPVAAVEAISALTAKSVGQAVNAIFPQGVALDPRTADIRLRTNDQELASYGPGTSFPLPPDLGFIRTSSYWACARHETVWFDNGWLFFDGDWKHTGTCTWNVTRFKDAAVFSGDPVNLGELNGRACQLIDLYPDRLVAAGVRYAVWSLLAYSRIPFSDSEDVVATLQWGEDAQAGDLFEPARAQMTFPVQGNGLVRYIAFVDLVERRLTYLDAELPSSVQSANLNGKCFGEMMPAVLERLAAVPSVFDLFKDATGRYIEEGSLPVAWSDENVVLPKGNPAYVFKPSNPENSLEPVDLSVLLSTKLGVGLAPETKNGTG